MDILYSDKNIAVIIKPVGLDSETETPAAIKQTLGGEIFPIHRLDKNVGGVMIYARTKAAAAALSKTIQEGLMIKEYVALVHGTPPENGDWEDLLFKDSRKNKVIVVKRERKGVKKARLEFKRLLLSAPIASSLSTGETSLVHVRLHTGRSHQIRVQFASRGFPLVGDHKYGSRYEATTPKLFSCRITFPYRGTTAVYEALPEWAQTNLTQGDSLTNLK